MSDLNVNLGVSEKFFKNELKLEPEQLTLKYMREQNAKFKSQKELIELEKSIRKAEFPVLLLGDNEEPGKPSRFLEKIQQDFFELGFHCGLGSHIYAVQKGRFEDEIEQEMFCDPACPKIIVLVSGKGFGTIGESKLIRLRPELNNKTLFFFDHEKNYENLINLVKEKKYPVEYKYPIPYTGLKELRAKILFGTLHWFYRYLRFKRNQDENNNNN
ncbi:MAG: hypothetical protein JW703_02840 [Candidatus Diapherotrites archaeon]|nr:hypothetical protein [Candidatus Diapherotrites archaeon]